MMQRLLFVLVTFIAGPVVLAGEVEKAFLPFYVVSTQKDPKLKKTEAVFEFHFINPEFLQAGRMPQISSSYNGTAHNFTPDNNAQHDLKVEPGSYLFQLYAFSFQEIYSDSVEIKPGYRTVINVYFYPADGIIEVAKPVIYLYPPADLEVTAIVEPAGKFTFTYPAYENGWTGTAHPDGSMTINGKTYPYLFWEAESRFNPLTVDRNSRFIVPQETVTAFLEEKLTEMGLNTNEQTDFITYWGPKMTGSEHYFVQFLFNGDCDRFAALTITPQPEQLFRVYMLWSPIDAATRLSPQPQPQPLARVNREQFYVIEWGGSQVPLQQILTSNN